MKGRYLSIYVLLVALSGAPATWAFAEGKAILSVSDATITSTATLVDAQDAFRVALSCTNHSASVNVRWGDSTVTATKGQRIPFGQTIEIRNSAPVYMISEGASITVSCTKETK